MEEEIGLKVKREDLQFFNIRKFKSANGNIKNNEFFYVFFLKFDGDIKKLKLQKEEVQEIRFFPIKKLEEELRDAVRHVPDENYWIEVINEVKRKLKK
jgi:isopentenyldiphosphate isomerase